MRQWIKFQRRIETDDGFGNVEGIFKDQFACWAEMKPLVGGETVISARLAARQPAVFIVRSDPLTRQVTPDWRIIHNGASYNVRSAINRDQKDKFLDVLCEGGIAT